MTAIGLPLAALEGNSAVVQAFPLPKAMGSWGGGSDNGGRPRGNGTEALVSDPQRRGGGESTATGGSSVAAMEWRAPRLLIGSTGWQALLVRSPSE